MNARIRRLAPRVLTVLVAAAAVAGLTACGGSDITRGRLEHSIPQSFANRYVAQAKLLGHTGVTVASLHARATCDKGGPKVADHGPGADWNCYLSWNDPNTPLPDGTGRFELNVHSNDCYSAGGPSKIVGLITITDTRGSDVPNPVFEWDTCFDPQSPDSLTKPAGVPSALTLPTGTIKSEAAGRVDPVLKCSAGAAGGCVGILTAQIGPRVVESVRYQLAPSGDNDFPFTLSGDERKPGSRLTLTAAPLIGTARRASTTLAVH
ncbi:MAG: hypothetical protein ABI808_14040 [Pseudonocardiales bacterium]